MVPKYRYFWRSSSTQPWQQRLSDRSNHTAIVRGDFQVLNLSCPLILFLSVLSTKRARHTSGHGPFSSLTMCSGPLSLLLAPSPFLLCFVLLHSGLWVISLRASNSVCVCVCVCVCVSVSHTHITFLGAPYLPLEHCTKLNEREKKRQRQGESKRARERLMEILRHRWAALLVPHHYTNGTWFTLFLSASGRVLFAFKEAVLLMSLYLPE